MGGEESRNGVVGVMYEILILLLAAIPLSV